MKKKNELLVRAADAIAKVEKKEAKKKRPSQKELEEAAYYRWLNRGCPSGDDLADWVEAEKSLGGKRR